MSTALDSQVKSKGRWKKGESGNPGGRPSLGKTELRQQIDQGAPEVLKIVMQAALDGDMAACRMILDRTVPPLKPRAQPLQLAQPEDRSPQGLAKALIDGAMSGLVDVRDAAVLLNAIAQFSRLDEPENDHIAAFETLPYDGV
ncbi:DUF5681 domain-containing protein [Halothiobacillus sp.]|uniref:DUF5681 domain-containing protein n=1 Tax=Halothiobacillus sp. TaxID=1891311 RepID=UPI00260667B3|nr:DUF5681 domain-containing protein [Halothiobacillus sp.]